jgi:CheY-like chemotaxis protein
VGRSVFEVYRDVPMLAEHVRRALNGDAFTDSVDLPSQKLRYETRYTPVLGPSGEVVEVIAVAVDVTERVAAAAAPPPPSAKEVDEQAEVVGAASRSPKTPRSRGRILVIDDEPVLASALGRTLETDFDVTVLSSGQEALRRLKEDQPFDVILCDLLMPGLTGMDLYEELSQSSPRIAERMIFMTGGTFTARARDFLAAVPNPALDKPFDLSMLHALLKARTMTT